MRASGATRRASVNISRCAAAGVDEISFTREYESSFSEEKAATGL
jgi:hypothetical protein